MNIVNIVAETAREETTVTTRHSGRCNCGQVTYEILGEPTFTYVCHCANCQKRSGSAFGMGLSVPVEQLDVQGELVCWERVSDEGNRNPRYSCPVCANVIYGLGAYTPGLAKVMPGTLDDTANLEPDIHIWTEMAQKWVHIPPEVPQYRKQPDSIDEAMALIEAYRLQRNGQRA